MNAKETEDLFIRSFDQPLNDLEKVLDNQQFAHSNTWYY